MPANKIGFFLQAGPSVSQTLHYLLVRLQVRADVVATSSKLGGFFKNAMLKLLLQMLEPGTGPIATQQGPLDAQCEFIQTVSNLDFKNCDLSIINNILKNLGRSLNRFKGIWIRKFTKIFSKF